MRFGRSDQGCFGRPHGTACDEDSAFMLQLAGVGRLGVQNPARQVKGEAISEAFEQLLPPRSELATQMQIPEPKQPRRVESLS